MTKQISERLLSLDTVAHRLDMSRETVRRHLPDLQAKGLQVIRSGPKATRVREESLNRLIKRAAEREEPLF